MRLLPVPLSCELVQGVCKVQQRALVLLRHFVDAHFGEYFPVFFGRCFRVEVGCGHRELWVPQNRKTVTQLVLEGREALAVVAARDGPNSQEFIFRAERPLVRVHRAPRLLRVFCHDEDALACFLVSSKTDHVKRVLSAGDGQVERGRGSAKVVLKRAHSRDTQGFSRR